MVEYPEHSPQETQQQPGFEHRVINESSYNYERAIGDVDSDGRNEIVATAAEEAEGSGIRALVWFRPPDWKVAPLISFGDSQDGYGYWRGDDLKLADMNGDGHLDIVGGLSTGPEGDSRLVWWQNPGPLRAAREPWRRHYLEDAGTDYVKNICVADIDADGKLDVIARSSTRLSIYFQESADIWFVRSWEIAPFEGLGVGDIAGNGRLDIAVNGRWYETPMDARRGSYAEHTYAQKWLDPPQPAESWQAPGVKIAVVDLDGDGRNEIVVAPAEYATKSMPIAWYSSACPKTEPWTEHVIEAGVRQAHTLQIADFDRDGRLDILAGAMTRDDNPDRGLWVYLQSPQGTFSRFDVQTQEVLKGSYSAVVGDLEGDGGVDIVNIRNFDRAPTEIWFNRLTQAT